MIAQSTSKLLELWGRIILPPTLIAARENEVFHAALAHIGPVALRLHRRGYQSNQAIEQELEWLGWLADHGLPVPSPVLSLNGRAVEKAGQDLVSVVRWLPGLPVGVSGAPLSHTEAELRQIFSQLGELLARLHDTCDAAPHGLCSGRPTWLFRDFVGPNPRWGDPYQNAYWTEGDRMVIREATNVVKSRVEPAERKGLGLGLIHADVLRENVLVDRGSIAIIDFDDGGVGHRAYDLATALVHNLEEPRLPIMAEALICGYSAHRLLPAHGADLVSMVFMRCLAATGWIASRYPADDARQELYAGRALHLALVVLGEVVEPWAASASDLSTSFLEIRP